MNLIHKIILITGLFALVLTIDCYGNTFTDERDGKEYKMVKIGEQVWMAENLNYEAEGSKCYDNKAENCAKYGRLYDWETAMKACPNEWHLPDTTEWNILADFAGGEEAAINLKAKSGWDNRKIFKDGTDKYGFMAMPGGDRLSDGSFKRVGTSGWWWSATEKDDAVRAYARHISIFRRMLITDASKLDMLSVRCVRD